MISLDPGSFTVDADLSLAAAAGHPTHTVIAGDNLDVVAALGSSVEGQGSIVYLDPPYGTSNYEQRFSDQRRGARWAEWIEPRVEAARTVLADDGLLFWQVSTAALHSARSVADAVLGPSRFVTQIVVERKAAAGLGQHGFMMDVVEFILVYRGDVRVKNAAAKSYAPISEHMVRQYDRRVVSTGRVVRSFVRHDERGSFVVEERQGAQVTRIPVAERTVAHHTMHLDQVAQTTNAQGVARFLPHIGDGLWSVQFVPKAGRHAGRRHRYWFYDRRLIVWLADTARVERGQLLKASTATNLWTGNLYQGLGAEGGVRFPGGKKPARVMGRILDMHPSSDGLVVDLFAGSGTTAATVIDQNRTVGRSRPSLSVTVDEDGLFGDVTVPRIRGAITGTLPNGRTGPSSLDGLVVARHTP